LRILKCGAVCKRDSDLFFNYSVLTFAVKPNARRVILMVG